jgi:transmembrane sensor
LNSQSRLRTRFTEQFRTVQLVEGEAIFRVAKNPRRPFRVRTGLATIEAVGTAFNVQARETRTVVTVLEGRVRVNQPAPGDSALGSNAATEMELTVGDQATLASSQPAQMISLLDTEKVTAWTDRRLIFEDTPLANAAAEFARYSSRTIRIDDPKIADRKITGVFDATDPASLVEFLSADQSLDVQDDTDGWAISAR